MKLKKLYSRSVNRGTFVEEADLGSWKKLQADVLKKYQSKNEVVIRGSLIYIFQHLTELSL